MPTDNHDKQKSIIRTKTDFGRRLPAEAESPGSNRDGHDFIRIHRDSAQD